MRVETLSRVTVLDENRLTGTGFAQDAVFFSTPRPYVEGDVRFYGSWLGSDTSTGSVRTGWYSARPSFYIFTSGRLDHPGEELWVEALTSNGTIARYPAFAGTAIGERWALEKFVLPAGVHISRFRLVAMDANAQSGGWVGFSEPFQIKGLDNSEIALQMVWIILTTGTCFVLLLGPGLILKHLLSVRGAVMSFVWLPVPGLIFLALLGLAVWKGPHNFSARTTARIFLWITVLVCTFFASRIGLSKVLSRMERRVLAVLILIACIALAKASYSIGPAGELYEGTISRTLAVGDRSDSRVPFHVVQIVASRSAAFSPTATALFSPWNFSHRGPVAGLAASPIVLASPVRVGTGKPELPWTIYDPEGFSAYRIAMIVMAAVMLATVYGLASAVLTEEWAFLALLVAVTAPFVLHELYFTWPKIAAAAFTLVAARLIFEARFLVAGFCLGIGYLCHPSALIWLPALFGAVVLRQRNTVASRFIGFVRSCALISAGLGFWLVLWKIVNRNHYVQSGFLSYFRMAGTLRPTVHNWLWVRYDSLLNTLVPLHLFLFDRADPSVNAAAGGPSPAIVQFFFQYWNTLPFAVGVLFFFCLLGLMTLALRQHSGWLIWVFTFPFLFFVVYWGATTTGLLREGLHAWVLALLIFSVYVWKTSLRPHGWFWRICSLALLLRGIDLLAMLLLPGLATKHAIISDDFPLSDFCSLLAMITGTLAIAIYAFIWSERLRRLYDRP